MFDLKVINSVLNQLENDRGIPRAKALDAIEQALASAYKKEYGKRGQIIRASFNEDEGTVTFQQVKEVADDSVVILPDEDPESLSKDDERERFDDERHIMITDAKRIKSNAEVGDEIAFPLEDKDDYGRISTQTAKQVIIQKIREAEKVSVHDEFAEKRGEIVSGTVQRFERGNLYIDLGRATGIMTYKEQIPGERFRQGERIRAYLLDVEESSRGIFLKLSRSTPKFLQKLFELEAPEVASGVVEIKSIAREAGSRSKVAVHSDDEYIDPVGACVGQRGVRVSTVMSALGNEKIDIIEWSENPNIFVEKALSPAEVMRVDLDEETAEAQAYVMADQQSLAIGKGGQNARLAAKLTGWTIDIRAIGGEDKEEGANEDEEENDPSTDEAETAVDSVDNEDVEVGTEDSAAEIGENESEGSTPEEGEDKTEDPTEESTETQEADESVDEDEE
ncbi:MAG: transcription termination factor NusA [Candidatus Paceibacterota bacterium]